MNTFSVATLSADADQLASFSQAIWGFTHVEVPVGFTFPSWEAAPGALADLPGRSVVVWDEFSYVMRRRRLRHRSKRRMSARA